jgi:hypothetical protein
LIKLENLPEVTDRALDGLKADESLKAKILNAAIQEEKPYTYQKIRHLAPVLLSSVAVMILCIFSSEREKADSFRRTASDSFIYCWKQ